MHRIFDVLTAVTTRRPGRTLAAVLLLSLAFGALASQAVTDDGVAVDDERSAALATIDEQFGDRQSVLQVVLRTDGDDVRSRDALAATMAITRAIRDSPIAATLIDGEGQPAIASFLGGAEAALAMEGRTLPDGGPDDLDDAAVRELNARALAQLPPEVAPLLEGLLGAGDPPTAGLVLVFQDTAGLDEDGVLAAQRELAAVIRGVDTPDGVHVEPFSFGLMLTGSDIGGEVGRLFGTALAIILVVLALVYWVRPDAGQRLRIVRRTAADVGLTLTVIVLAVVWMQGLGVLLGPDFAGLIGYFSPQTQIVPILIVGLGVDFAIHLLARYRAEAGQGAAPAEALAISLRHVGLALVLVTAATAIGFLTNLASPVEFLATLGVLAAVGIVAAFVLTLTVVPAARVALDRRALARGRMPRAALARQTDATLPRIIGRTAWLAERAPVATLLVAVTLAGVGAFGFTQLDSEFELTDFVPQDEPLLATFEVIQTSFAGGFEETTEVLLEGELATVAAHNALADAVEQAGQLDDVATLGGEADATSIVSALRAAASDPQLADALAARGVDGDGRFVGADDSDVAEVYDLLRERVPAATQVLAGDGGAWLGRVSLRTTAGQEGALALERGLVDTFEPLADLGLQVTPTSQQLVQANLGARIEDSQLLSLAIALGAAMALLVVHFAVTARRPALGVLTVLPVGLVLAATFGTMALTGIPLNPVTATLAALSIGIGVPFTIHVTSRFLEERRSPAPEGQSAVRRTVAQTGGALAGSALTTAIGFGILTTSTLKPFEQLGFVIVYAIAYSLAAAVLVLPSLLTLWDRADQRRADGQRRNASEYRVSVSR